MGWHKLIDNSRVKLADELRQIAPYYRHLSIATGYWDFDGMLQIIDDIQDYESIRLLIGQEPLPHRLQSLYKTDPDAPESLFPDENFMYDMVESGKATTEHAEQVARLRLVASKTVAMIEAGILQVKVFRHPRLHAKAYIFGTFDSKEAIGIVGSSNFTGAGFTSNAELNSLEDDQHIVAYQPQNTEQEHGHLSWFEALWNDPEAVDWSGDFVELIQSSPLGDKTYGPYDVYIKTLIEVFPDELIPPMKLSEEIGDILYTFQNRNAGILINKLNKMGVAMLADSVGLGKTVTAGAVIKNYLDSGKNNVVVIAPAALKQQWINDLGSFFGLIEKRDYRIISLQDINALQELLDDFSITWMPFIDLFVIDEAHNLRTENSTRYRLIEELLQANLDAHVLMLTATPVNNSLMDFANQIKLGSKGSLTSVNVPYVDTDGNLRLIDFFEALKIIQAEVAKAEKDGTVYDWDRRKNTLSSGLKRYLVRSTRQGVEAEGGIKQIDGTKSGFPESRVEQIGYTFPEVSVKLVTDSITDVVETVFEGINPSLLSLDVVADLTQLTAHPLDILKTEKIEPRSLIKQCGLPENYWYKLFLETEVNSIIPNIFQVINCLGYIPYRSEIYKHRYHSRSIQQIYDLGLKGDASRRLQVAMSIHNLLHVTWLKRLESSCAALLKSVQYYQKRLTLFEKYLNKGYIITLGDTNLLENEYEEDIERAFDDYDRYLAERQEALDSNQSVEEIKKYGIERIEADFSVYNLDVMRVDIDRDKKICTMLINVLSALCEPTKDGKLLKFTERMEQLINDGKYGQKILVFSFFADTISYLQDSLPKVLHDTDLLKRAAFISGSSHTNIETIARRFSPKAKKYSLKANEDELDLLFSTDVLSEGQNLQDAGILINFDLHWNPVRMIQRNGRINRLGSTYNEILIANVIPHDDLEAYLHLVRRLERKIETIRNSIGIDQSVLGIDDLNPIEFIEYFSSDSEQASAAANAAVEASEGVLGILEFGDEYVYDLRRFIEEHHDDNELQRIMRIPLGKWNYLPRHIDQNSIVGGLTLGNAPIHCIALARVLGKKSQTGINVNETVFVSVDTHSRYFADTINDEIALACIKTVPEDNERKSDKIEAERATVANRMEAQARAKINRYVSFELKPSDINALEYMQRYYTDGSDLLGIVRENIRDARQERDFKKLVRAINSEIKIGGYIGVSTLNRFTALINTLKLTVNETIEVEAVEGVLFYHSQG